MRRESFNQGAVGCTGERKHDNNKNNPGAVDCATGTSGLCVELGG